MRLQSIDRQEVVVMAIREKLMGYFKGWAGDRVVENSSIRIQSIEPGHIRFRYERREYELHSPSIVLFNGYEIAKLDKSPHTLALNTTVLNRSPQLRELTTAIKAFMNEYLAGVEVIEYGQ